MNRDLERQLREELDFADSYSRMGALLALKSAPDFWKLMGEWWGRCDNIAQHWPEIDAAFVRYLKRRRFPIRAAMDADALAFYDSLPQQVEIWRGCYAGNRYGYSWTTDRALAAQFPFFNRYRQPDAEANALLLGGIVAKDTIAFVNTHRAESEVVVPGVIRYTSTQPAIEVWRELARAA
jgi:hypothetical protein